MSSSRSSVTYEHEDPFTSSRALDGRDVVCTPSMIMVSYNKSFLPRDRNLIERLADPFRPRSAIQLVRIPPTGISNEPPCVMIPMVRRKNKQVNRTIALDLTANSSASSSRTLTSLPVTVNHVELPQPSAAIEQPSAAIEQPSAAIEQPSAAIEQPSAAIEQPSLMNSVSHKKRKSHKKSKRKSKRRKLDVEPCQSTSKAEEHLKLVKDDKPEAIKKLRLKKVKSTTNNYTITQSSPPDQPLSHQSIRMVTRSTRERSSPFISEIKENKNEFSKPKRRRGRAHGKVKQRSRSRSPKPAVSKGLVEHDENSLADMNIVKPVPELRRSLRQSRRKSINDGPHRVISMRLQEKEIIKDVIPTLPEEVVDPVDPQLALLEKLSENAAKSNVQSPSASANSLDNLSHFNPSLLSSSVTDLLTNDSTDRAVGRLSLLEKCTPPKKRSRYKLNISNIYGDENNRAVNHSVESVVRDVPTNADLAPLPSGIMNQQILNSCKTKDFVKKNAAKGCIGEIISNGLKPAKKGRAVKAKATGKKCRRIGSSPGMDKRTEAILNDDPTYEQATEFPRQSVGEAEVTESKVEIGVVESEITENVVVDSVEDKSIATIKTDSVESVMTENTSIVPMSEENAGIDAMPVEEVVIESTLHQNDVTVVICEAPVPLSKETSRKHLPIINMTDDTVQSKNAAPDCSSLGKENSDSQDLSKNLRVTITKLTDEQLHNNSDQKLQKIENEVNPDDIFREVDRKGKKRSKKSKRKKYTLDIERKSSEKPPLAIYKVILNEQRSDSSKKPAIPSVETKQVNQINHSHHNESADAKSNNLTESPVLKNKALPKLLSNSHSFGGKSAKHQPKEVKNKNEQMHSNVINSNIKDRKCTGDKSNCSKDKLNRHSNTVKDHHNDNRHRSSTEETQKTQRHDGQKSADGKQHIHCNDRLRATEEKIKVKSDPQSLKSTRPSPGYPPPSPSPSTPKDASGVNRIVQTFDMFSGLVKSFPKREKKEAKKPPSSGSVKTVTGASGPSVSIVTYIPNGEKFCRKSELEKFFKQKRLPFDTKLFSFAVKPHTKHIKFKNDSTLSAGKMSNNQLEVKKQLSSKLEASSSHSDKFSNNLKEVKVLAGGWKRVTRLRINGVSAGRSDTVYYPPTGRRLRSKQEVARYLLETGSPLTLEDIIPIGASPAHKAVLSEGNGSKLLKKHSKNKAAFLSPKFHAEKFDGKNLLYVDPKLPAGWKRKIVINKKSTPPSAKVHLISPNGKKLTNLKKLKDYMEQRKERFDPHNFNFSPFRKISIVEKTGKILNKKKPVKNAASFEEVFNDLSDKHLVSEVVATNDAEKKAEMVRTKEEWLKFYQQISDDNSLRSAAEITRVTCCLVDAVRGIMVLTGISNNRLERKAIDRCKSLKCPDPTEEKNMLAFPWINKIIGTRAELSNISESAIECVNVATEIFLRHLVLGAYRISADKHIEYGHVAELVNSNSSLASLRQLIPRRLAVRQVKTLIHPPRYSSFTV